MEGKFNGVINSERLEKLVPTKRNRIVFEKAEPNYNRVHWQVVRLSKGVESKVFILGVIKSWDGRKTEFHQSYNGRKMNASELMQVANKMKSLDKKFRYGKPDRIWFK